MEVIIKLMILMMINYVYMCVCVCWRVKVKELKHHFHHPQMLPTKAAVVVMREPYYAYVLCIMPMCLTNCIFKILIKTPPPPPPQPWTD